MHPEGKIFKDSYNFGEKALLTGSRKKRLTEVFQGTALASSIESLTPNAALFDVLQLLQNTLKTDNPKVKLHNIYPERISDAALRRTATENIDRAVVNALGAFRAQSSVDNPIWVASTPVLENGQAVFVQRRQDTVDEGDPDSENYTTWLVTHTQIEVPDGNRVRSVCFVNYTSHSEAEGVKELGTVMRDEPLTDDFFTRARVFTDAEFNELERYLYLTQSQKE